MHFKEIRKYKLETSLSCIFFKHLDKAVSLYIYLSCLTAHLVIENSLPHSQGRQEESDMVVMLMEFTDRSSQTLVLKTPLSLHALWDK